jgi:hypothetical protein
MFIVDQADLITCELCGIQLKLHCDGQMNRVYRHVKGTSEKTKSKHLTRLEEFQLSDVGRQAGPNVRVEDFTMWRLNLRKPERVLLTIDNEWYKLNMPKPFSLPDASGNLENHVGEQLNEDYVLNSASSEESNRSEKGGASGGRGAGEEKIKKLARFFLW